MIKYREYLKSAIRKCEMNNGGTDIDKEYVVDLTQEVEAYEKAIDILKEYMD